MGMVQQLTITECDRDEDITVSVVIPDLWTNVYFCYNFLTSPLAGPYKGPALCNLFTTQLAPQNIQAYDPCLRHYIAHFVPLALGLQLIEGETPNPPLHTWCNA